MHSGPSQEEDGKRIGEEERKRKKDRARKKKREGRRITSSSLLERSSYGIREKSGEERRCT